MNELAGLACLSAGGAVLAGGAALAACCLRFRSSVEYLLAAYILAWSWLVAVTSALTPFERVTRGWLAAGLAAGLVAAIVSWQACGRPSPPAPRLTLAAVRKALRRPVVAVLAIVVALGATYTAALAFFTPTNDGDALAYHLPRAAFWRQEHAVGYIANAVYGPLNAHPPISELGQLATMVLSGLDRYVALPQLSAYVALAVAVAGLARRVGLDHAEATFAALLFATLPVVVVQASGALNDLVVASFLATAIVFALRPTRISLVLCALALALALGTKLTAVLALPGLGVVVLLGLPRRSLPGVALAALGGIALGSAWYLVNLAETGSLDGGLEDELDQRVAFSVPVLTTNALRFLLELIDMSGAPRPYATLYVAAGAALIALGIASFRSPLRHRCALALAGVVTGLVFLTPSVFTRGQDLVVRTWALLGRPETAAFEGGWALNVEADPGASWYGPLGAILLTAGTVVAITYWARRRASSRVLGLALAPWLLLLTLALTLVWEPARGRFLVVGVALTAGTWGFLLRTTVGAAAATAIAATSLVLTLANHAPKPSGLGSVWAREKAPVLSVRSIWRDSRAQAQARSRAEGEEPVFARFEQVVPANASVAVAARDNDFLSPYFGPSLDRVIVLVPAGDEVPPGSEWLVSAPGVSARRCRDAWQVELDRAFGWRIERRIAADRCPAVEP